MNFDLIVFDWDGTLYDSTTLIVQVIQSACRDLGVAVPSAADAAYVIGSACMTRSNTPRPGYRSRRYPAAERALPPPLPRAPARIGAVPRHLPMLHALKARGHRLAVATGKARRGLDEALAQSQLGELFDATRTADETAGKPDPLMLNQLMRLLGAAPGAHLDDRRHHARPDAGGQRRHGARGGQLRGA